MLAEKIARKVGPAKIDIAYAQRGDPKDSPVLLIMGLGAQLVHWSDGFLDALVRRGLHVTYFDNRDAGLSTHFDDAPKPDLAAALAGDLSSASYTLSDMAADAVGLLDALGIHSAHIVGSSMGGAIAQVMAVEHPTRVRSLTSIMASTGASSVGQIKPEVLEAAFSGPPATTKQEAIDQAIRKAPIVRGTSFAISEEDIANTTGLAWDRDHNSIAGGRQAVAMVATGDRTEKLQRLNVPTLVIHGTHDGICDVSGGRATAAAIPNAELMVFEGMGHSIPSALWIHIADGIASTVKKF